MKKFHIVLASALILGSLAGCGEEAPVTEPTVITTAPTEATAPTEPTEPTKPVTPPDAVDEEQVEYAHHGFYFKLGESFTAGATQGDEDVFRFDNGKIRGEVTFGSAKAMLGEGVDTSRKAAEQMLNAQEGSDAWMGSSTGVCYYVVFPSQDRTVVRGVYVSGDKCWDVRAESEDPADEQLLIRIVGRGGVRQEDI